MSYFSWAALGVGLTATCVSAGPISFTDSGTFSTTDAGMWGNETSPLSASPNFYIVDESTTNSVIFGGIETVDTSAAQDAYDLAIAACDALPGVTVSQCRSQTIPGPIPSRPTQGSLEPGFVYDGRVLAWEGLVAGCVLLGATRDFCLNGVSPLGNRPPDSYKSGKALTIDEAALKLGVNFDVQLAPGSVDATQAFEVDVMASKGEGEAGEEIILSFSGEKGDASLDTELGVFDTSISGLIDAKIEASYEQYNFGSKEYDLTLVDFDTGEQKTEILGLALGSGEIEARIIGESAPFDISDGKELSIPTPGIFPPPLDKILQFPLGAVAAYGPDFDVSATAENGEKVEVSTVSETRDGLGPADNEFFKVELDLDVVSVFTSGVPLGIKAGIPLLAEVEGNIFDADLAGYFGMAQTQSFEAGDIEVYLEFSHATEVETSPGVWELVTSYVAGFNEDVKIRHPGKDLEITPTYRLASNTYANKTQFQFAPAFEYEFFEVDFSGALLSGITDFRLYGDAVGLGGPINLGGPAYDSSFALEGFSDIMGTAFSLLTSTGVGGGGGNGGTIAPIPLPPGAILLGSGLVLAGAIRRRRRAA
ncbi:MAG: hypothetical protein AAFN59_04155 [Pseudomonadota bacterium]